MEAMRATFTPAAKDAIRCGTGAFSHGPGVHHAGNHAAKVESSRAHTRKAVAPRGRGAAACSTMGTGRSYGSCCPTCAGFMKNTGSMATALMASHRWYCCCYAHARPGRTRRGRLCLHFRVSTGPCPRPVHVVRVPQLYLHHGIGVGFGGGYQDYFGDTVDNEAVRYLMLVRAGRRRERRATMRTPDVPPPV